MSNHAHRRPNLQVEARRPGFWRRLARFLRPTDDPFARSTAESRMEARIKSGYLRSERWRGRG